MTRYTMIADLDRCIGCQTCVAACRHANATSPGVQWRKVLDFESGVYPAVSRTFVPVGCQHCDDPPCMHVCPTTATRKRQDGIVSVEYDLCIGCAYCDVACPYQARFKISETVFAYGKKAMRNEELQQDPRRLGVSQKCTFCSDRVDAGCAAGLVPGRDPTATPACVNSCIADALSFGDMDDPSSNVRKILAERPHFRMHDELGTAPNFYYLLDHHGPEAANLPPAEADSEAGYLRNRGIEPSHQKHWDWKAANNFLFGGAGTALFVFGVLGNALGIPFAAVGAAALALVALGLFGLFFKIGRPARFIYVFRQPRRSWMSREAWLSVFFFAVGTCALWRNSLALAGAGVVLALAFLFSQAMILKEARGIPVWRVPTVVPLIVLTGLCEGAGLYALAIVVARELQVAAIPAILSLLALTMLRGIGWAIYRHSLNKAGAPVRSLQVLDRFQPWFYAGGIISPIALLGLGYLAPVIMSPAVALAAVAAVGCGWTMKFILVTRAAYNQGFSLTRVVGGGSMDIVQRPGWTPRNA